MRKKLLIANWKMNGSLSLIQEWVPKVAKAAGESDMTLALCPPDIYIPEVEKCAKGSKLAWGAQNVSGQEQGAFTGQVSAKMLRELGCRYVIIGHSERRLYNHETDHWIAEKFVAAQQEDLIPVLCVGETLEEYNAGNTEAVVTRQIAVVLKHAGIAAFSQAVIAYEPVWAIGTGLAATPEQAQAVHEIIRMQIAEADIDIAARIQILYGGSVKPDNAEALFSQDDIDGGLVGGASLDAAQFLKIAQV